MEMLKQVWFDVKVQNDNCNHIVKEIKSPPDVLVVFLTASEV